VLLRLPALLALLLWSGLALGQLSYRFRNFGIAEGLSQSSVTCMVQDDIGTMWIGTQDGLNRFDGQQFEIFTPEYTKGLESGYIHSALKDRNGSLWFGTANGLTNYNPHLEQFFTYSPSGSGTFAVEAIDQAANGDLWLATSTQGIAVWEAATQKIRLLSSALPSRRIHYLKLLNDSDLLVSTEEQGVFRYNIPSGKWTKLIPQKYGYGAWLVNDCEAFGTTQLLLSTNHGLWLLDRSDRINAFLPGIEKDFGATEISDVIVTGKDEIFIATQSSGLLTARIGSNGYYLTQAKQDIFQKNALAFDEINGLYQDANGIIWAGTLRGLSAFDPEKQGFLGVGPSGNPKQGLPSASIWGFTENTDASQVFIVTDIGISQLDRKTGVFRHLPVTGSGGGATTNLLSALFVKEGTILVGASDGLYELSYTPRSFAYKKIAYGIDNPDAFDKVYGIIPYKNGSYFLATKGGAMLYDRQSGVFTAFAHDPKRPGMSISPGICRLVYKGVDGTVYFGTSSGGLNVYRPGADGAGAIVPFRFNAAILSITKDYVSTLFQDDASELWIGTTGSGLIRMDLKTGSADRFNKIQGLPNNFVYGILPDIKGNLWLSTNRGLARFDPRTATTVNFSEVHGLLSNEFNTGAYMRSGSGELFFGGISGYNFFRPSQVTGGRSVPEVRFTKFKLGGSWLRPGDEDAPFSSTVSEISRIELPYTQRSFTLRFVASDLLNRDLLEYKYRLVGSGEEDIFLGSTNEIRFNLLSPGNYRLEIYARYTGGEWSDFPATMEIEIAAPFWAKWWFWVITAILLALIVWVVVRRRIEQGRREQVRLEMKIADRTREIRNQATRIEIQSQIIQEEKEKVEEQRRLLQIEKDKTETLLRNIIPEATAEELKNKGRASARAYKTVSVLFTDFVGFTKIAERMKPTELVHKLDVYFRKFDEIIVRNNLEKIKTIGDAYMCAGGVPVRNNTNPIDSVLAALQIREYMSRLKNDAIANGAEYWDLRLGIHTGEVTAGVIGSERLAYDIWGATVNQAQRMEMMGEPGRVTISGTTFKFIEPYFECTFRGKVQSKSKGMIDMFTVERIKPELSRNSEGIYPNERFQQIVNLHLYSSINYYKAERHIMKVLEKGLSKSLHYHSIAHTRDVVRAVEHYALLEGVTDEGLFLLKSAATYHDAGFVESYEKNEPIGARMAEEILPKYGYSEQHIQRIKELIFVTQIPHQPRNKLEEIICDADLDYLGRDDFHQIADKLRLELREHGKIGSDREWDKMQVAFLNMHKYFTPTAIASRQKKKMQNLQEVIGRLERDEYID
jgi:ligand-binding sensor domain-containing protein/class 3 adenylate cyclase/predicted metal-dependent HD superfamily phosphohydrolase